MKSHIEVTGYVDPALDPSSVLHRSIGEVAYWPENRERGRVEADISSQPFTKQADCTAAPEKNDLSISKTGKSTCQYITARGH